MAGQYVEPELTVDRIGINQSSFVIEQDGFDRQLTSRHLLPGGSGAGPTEQGETLRMANRIDRQINVQLEPLDMARKAALRYSRRPANLQQPP